jgi:hypothetical protein
VILAVLFDSVVFTVVFKLQVLLKSVVLHYCEGQEYENSQAESLHSQCKIALKNNFLAVSPFSYIFIVGHVVMQEGS